MMKKGFFLIHVHQKDASSSGVMKKVNAQIKVLGKYTKITFDLFNTYKNGESISLWQKIKMRLPFTAVDYTWDYDVKYANADYIYMRRPGYIDCAVVRLFKRIKNENPKCKIILEIPTYPYLSETLSQGWGRVFIFALKDIVNHKRLKGLVDRIVTFSPDQKIWGIPTISVKNGVDFSKIELPVRNQYSDTIHLIEVSSINFWHGYDRLLEGMGLYYKNGGKRNIVFHIVGNGASIPLLKDIIQKYHLEKHAIIHGNKSGRELDELYGLSYIGVDSLGRHRSNNSTNSSLKSREYVAYGLPFICAVPCDFADRNWPYIMNVPQDDSPIDIEKVITFFDGIYKDNDSNVIAKNIRNYAETRCDMDVVMQPIINYINE